jgi:hypothetical protein
MLFQSHYRNATKDGKPPPLWDYQEYGYFTMI